jgi:uncharacterized membrane protein required for colicin V production
MSGWNGLDFFIFIILVLNMVVGMTRGGSREGISLMCLSAALIVTIKFTIPLANLINQSPLIADVVNNNMIQRFMIAIDAGELTENLLRQVGYSISLLICFVGTFSICEAGLSVTGFLESYGFPYAIINRKMGGALGLVRGYIISLILLSILAIHLNPGNDSRFISGSYFAGLFASQTRLFDSLISSQEVDQYHKLYEQQNIKPEQLYKVLNKPEDMAPVQPASTQQPSQPDANPPASNTPIMDQLGKPATTTPANTATP